MSRLQGLQRLAGLHFFLDSRIARRIFRVLLVAALLPTALAGGLIYSTFEAREEAQARREAKVRLKQMGLRLFDRLDAARTTLAVHAAGSDWRVPPVLESRGRMHLIGVRTVAADAMPTAPPPLSWQEPAPQRTREARPEGLRDAARAGTRATTPTAVVQLAVRDRSGKAWWLAEVAPEYLWSDFRGDGAGAGLCVLGPGGERLFCPLGPPDAAADAAEWRLFMGGEFEAADWRIVGPRLAPRVDEAGEGDGTPLARLVALTLAGTLILAALLGLAMVRRTLVPLERLTAGTRALAQGDHAARVDLPPGDEFGELATSLNGMAARIERQISALEVQAAVDRKILDGAPLEIIFRRVLARLAQLAPGAHVAIIARDVASGEWRLHGNDPAHAPQTLAPPDDAWQTSADGLAGHCLLAADTPPWLQRAFFLASGRTPPAGAALCWVPALWRDEPVALLLVCAPARLALDAAGAQEVETLRDRVAIALAAAAREHHLVERAVRDNLTGLLNRNGLHDACDQRLAAPAPAEPPAPFNVLLIDLDGFKEVNDTLGHPVGDAVLRAVSDRLGSRLPAGATLARVGGDEFVVLQPAASEAAESLAETLCNLVAQPISHREHVVHLGASVGIASHPADATDRDELLRRADVAMYAAKAAGRGRWRRYADTMDAQATERAWITRELRAALERGTETPLELHYQPRVDPRDGHVSSTEALVRWTHPERGAIAPMRFVPVAEETGLIDRLGAFVLHAALAQQRRWRDAGVASGRVAVNVSARQLRDPGFTSAVLAALQRHGLQPADLELEITESLFAGDASSVQRALQPLREQGVWVALDDFGTGYSSLSALQSLPIDVLKIDRSFVIELGVRDSAQAVVRSIIALARALGKRVVAEGVETAEQERQLLALGCDEFQGYLYARPLPPAPFEARVAAGFANAPAAPAMHDGQALVTA
ncbi:MAG: EAL domain-containing protein [Rubrivivax sp.]|nr:EAL domain-containing protein [Rubrivivax sp.]